MSRARSPFSAAGVLALVLVGAAAFLLFLYAIAAGWTGNGGNQAATERGDSNALNGFSALADLLERRGHDVSVVRGRNMFDDEESWGEDLLILTPSLDTSAEDLAAVIEERRYSGPTIIILPKWTTAPVLPAPEGEQPVPDDWVRLNSGYAQVLFEGVPLFQPMELGQGQSGGWQGLGLTGQLPDPTYVQAVIDMPGKQLEALVTDAEGDLLVGQLADGAWDQIGTFGGDGAMLVEASAQGKAEDPAPPPVYVPYDQSAKGKGSTEGAPPVMVAPPPVIQPAPEYADPEIDYPAPTYDSGAYPLILVAEPDLFNNYGMADQARAQLAVAVIEQAMGDAPVPIVFDVAIDGMGQNQNLLTLAFRPPFLAATLCLLAAMLVVGWRAFRRFGPPLAEEPAMAHGKTQLASNGAALVQRLRRWHLLGAPYAALVAARIAAALHIRESDEAAREAAIDAALVRQGHDGHSFSRTAASLRSARRLPEILRAAGQLQSIERMLVK